MTSVLARCYINKLHWLNTSMFVNAPLPDSYTGVMCDSTGHSGFSSFDNTLVLWGGGNPGASCGDKMKRESEMKKVRGEKNSLRNTRKKKKHDKYISENSFQLKWHAAISYFVSWWLLAENASKMTHKLCQNLVYQPLLNRHAWQ